LHFLQSQEQIIDEILHKTIKTRSKL